MRHTRLGYQFEIEEKQQKQAERKVYNEYRKKRIEELFKQGISVDDIAGMLCIGIAGVRKKLQDAGLLKKKVKNFLDDDIIVRAFKEGKEIKEIAFYYNIDSIIVISALKKHGLVKEGTKKNRALIPVVRKKSPGSY